MTKKRVCLNLANDEYNAFREICKKNFSSTSAQFNLFMQAKIKEEKEKERRGE